MINVSNIERFATHDGPGIRTTVFLKGCSLRCPWCANPETWDVKPTLMYDETKCIHCHSCEKACRNHAITFDPDFHWDKTKKENLEEIIDICPTGALSINGKVMSTEQIVKEVLKDKDYYEESHGGVTLSGGEPFYQFDAFLDLLKALKKEGLHIAIETTGHYPQEQLKKAMPYIDLFLFDIKNLDEKRMMEVPHGNLEQILNNFDYITSKRSKDVIVRVPVIPGFNEDQLEQIIRFAKHHHVKEVNLLPYHSMGKRKWHQLQREYYYEDLPMMNKEHLAGYANDFVKIGG